jgi:cell division protein FtsL
MNSRRIQLHQEILKDIKRHGLTYLLASGLLASALNIIYTTHMTREYIVQASQLMSERDQLNIEWRHLLLEQSSLQEHARVSEIAQKELSMQRPTATQERLITLP